MLTGPFIITSIITLTEWIVVSSMSRKLWFDIVIIVITDHCWFKFEEAEVVENAAKTIFIKMIVLETARKGRSSYLKNEYRL